ncbi:9359_t:CDS:2 [Acaulospora morrowiae]|uniref:9359_t:CDS:1 n=1 Tax=Acaulospora morrowiae TaxID=94023 RepID=A0A9N8ZU48_9GLOM|nr:9359_t:CDS:2 [Acaulospora morrowiae]
MRVPLWNPLATTFFGNICSKLFIILVLWCLVPGDSSRNFFNVVNSLIVDSDATRNSIDPSFEDIKTRRERINLKGICYADNYSSKCHIACTRVSLPCTISSSSSSYIPGGKPLIVKIDIDEDIDGMMVYAVHSHNVNIKVGSWSRTNKSDYMIYDECTGHRPGKDQTLISHERIHQNTKLTWFPPSNSKGSIIFRVLLVRLSSRAGYDIHEKHVRVSIRSTTNTTITTTGSSVSQTGSHTISSTSSESSSGNTGSSTPLSEPTNDSCDYVYGAPTPQPLSCSAAIGRIDEVMKGMMDFIQSTGSNLDI